ncbi:hypothetical protein GCM10018783_16790 [Streptomyces griseosporeus]|nr:hypothetical protein GCM10018783_16790 [Streptomyces griseosporeus]
MSGVRDLRGPACAPGAGGWCPPGSLSPPARRDQPSVSPAVADSAPGTSQIAPQRMHRYFRTRMWL